MEDIQRYCQENQMGILWWKNSRNYIQELKTLGSHKLGQKQKLLTIKALHFNSQPCIKLNELWQALHQSFNSAQNCQININILDKLFFKLILKWNPFSKEEIKIAILKYNDSSTPGPDGVL